MLLTNQQNGGTEIAETDTIELFSEITGFLDRAVYKI